jgi:hypothetical protein
MKFRQFIEAELQLGGPGRKPFGYRPLKGQHEALQQWMEANRSIANKRIHMSYGPIGSTMDVPQIVQSGYKRMNGKPFGLWYAFGQDWVEFVLNENPGGIVDFIYELEINPTKVLVVKDRQTVEYLDKNFGVMSDWAKHGWISNDKYGRFGGIQRIEYGPGIRGDKAVTLERPKLLNWEQMRSVYDGIEVYPDKVDAAWIDEWAVDSGCIWNRAGIRRVHLLARYNKDSNKYE